MTIFSMNMPKTPPMSQQQLACTPVSLWWRTSHERLVTILTVCIFRVNKYNLTVDDEFQQMPDYERNSAVFNAVQWYAKESVHFCVMW
jgi:hypothetical protein